MFSWMWYSSHHHLLLWHHSLHKLHYMLYMQKASDTHPLLTFPQMPYMALYFTILYAIMQYLYVKHTSRKSTIKLHSNLKKIFFTWMKKEELLRSLKQKLLLYILEAWLISPYFISALRLISFCEWCLFATPLYCHMGETNRDSYFTHVRIHPIVCHWSHCCCMTCSDWIQCEMGWGTSDECILLDYVHFSLKKLRVLSITFWYNALPFLIFDYGFHTSSTKLSRCINFIL